VEDVTSETLMTAIDYAGFKHDFRVLFGFEVRASITPCPSRPRSAGGVAE